MTEQPPTVHEEGAECLLTDYMTTNRISYPGVTCYVTTSASTESDGTLVDITGYLDRDVEAAQKATPKKEAQPFIKCTGISLDELGAIEKVFTRAQAVAHCFNQADKTRSIRSQAAPVIEAKPATAPTPTPAKPVVANTKSTPAPAS